MSEDTERRQREAEREFARSLVNAPTAREKGQVLADLMQQKPEQDADHEPSGRDGS